MSDHLRADQALVPTLVDRLLDDDPDGPIALDPMRTFTASAMRDALKRDLEALLNARRRAVSVPRELSETCTSLLNYGLTDITNSRARTASVRADLGRMLAGALAQFEPRLTSVKVTLRDNADPHDRTYRFRIEAILNIEPAPELVCFDSFIEPVTASVYVKEADDV
ncbi:MAG: type VI secretion system baseplate subunit TssE [Geminicoccaceae bacterium]